MKKKLFALLSVLCLLLVVYTVPASAQNYRFQVPLAEVNLFVQSDGTVSIEYTFELINDQNAHVIDFVDIGLPNSSYNIADISAEVNGMPVDHIANSSVVSPGIELGLEGNAIPPGQAGRIHAVINGVRNVLYHSDAQDVQEAYASVEFSPTWFGAEYVEGVTDYTFTLYLPAGINPDEPRYHTPRSWVGDAEPQSALDEQGRVFYRWHSIEANMHTQYYFGSSFPARMVPEDAITSEPGWFEAAIAMVIAVGSLIISLVYSVICSLCPFLPFIAVIFYTFYANRKRRLKYYPPKVSVEGHGIKRGLTAVQAAILLELPVDQVLTMVLFSTLKKNAARVSSRNPLQLTVISPQPDGLYDYERAFLQAFSGKTDDRTRKQALQAVIIALIKSVQSLMKGFSHKETTDYYRSIMERAWQQVQEADTPQVQAQKLDEAFEWTMLDRNFTDRSGEVFPRGVVYLPTWWGHYDPSYHATVSSYSVPANLGAGGVPSSFSLPHLPGADFAASIINGVQDFSSNVIGNVGSFTGAITQVTNPPPQSSSGGGGGFHGGGGHSCACACACAGCACACAGGGR